MNESKTVRLARLLNDLAALGFTYAEANRLRRISMTLTRWATAECNGEIERDETTGKPLRMMQVGFYPYTRKGFSIPDREAGARKQLAAIMEAYPSLWHYIQGDPRGCALYVGTYASLPIPDRKTIARHSGENAAKTPASRLRWNISQHYNTRGIAVCV